MTCHSHKKKKCCVNACKVNADELSVSGTSNLCDNVTMKKDLTVQGKTVLTELLVSDLATFNNDVIVQGNMSVEGMTVQDLTVDKLMVKMAEIQALYSCLVKTNTAILGEVRTDLRQQFRTEILVDLMNQLVNAYFNNRNVIMTVPDFLWTGENSIPTDKNLPKKTVNVAELTADNFLEIVLSLGALIYYNNEDLAHFAYLSTDILNSGFPGQGDQASSTDAVIKITQFILDKIAAHQLFGQDITRELGIRLLNSYFKSLYNFYVNPLYFFNSSWTQLYSGVMHKHYNTFFNFDSGYGIQDYMSFYWNVAYLQFFGPEENGVSGERMKLLPKLLMSDVRSMSKVIAMERAGINTYFWVKLFVDPVNSQITALPVDAEGNLRPAELAAGTAPYATEAIYPDVFARLNGGDLSDTMSAPFRELAMRDLEGTLQLTFKDSEDDGMAGLETLIKYPLGDEEGEKVICELESIWNNLLVPLFKEYREVLEVRAQEAQDQEYIGAWRAKIPVVEKVERNSDGSSKSIIVPFADTSVSIPMKESDNASYAASQATVDISEDDLLNLFVKTQGDIAEMDKWLLDMLQNALDIHDKDQFLLLKKKDLGRNIVSGSPYSSIDDIFKNYASVEKQVDNASSDSTISDLTYQSGNALNDFFYDVKEYLCDIHVKNNYVQYQFANVGVAGLYKVNSVAHLVTYDEVIADINVAIYDNKSDLEILGRHYGYNVDGSTKADEWITVGTKLLYEFQTFDYIYRQHYAVNTSAPMTPSNTKDPVTNKEYYQYTDAGDEARRDAFLTAFSLAEVTTGTQARIGKPGSFNRWKYDYEFQKIAGYVIGTAASKGLLSAEFADTYYTPYFVDKNAPPPTPPEIEITFRIRGGITASVNSGTSVSKARSSIQITVLFPTLDPLHESSMRANLGILLHEGALGHGFDGIPNGVDFLLGNKSELSWLTNVKDSSGFYDENFFLTTPNLGPGLVTLFEGWATFGEILGINFGYYFIKFDENGQVTIDSNNVVPAIYGMIQLSRIAARQVNAVGLNFSKYSFSFYKMVNTFYEMSNIPISDSRGYHARFVLHPMQQTGYAAGLIINLSLVNYLTEQVELAGCEFDLSKYVEFRILRTDYILGSSLVEIATNELDTFKKNCV